ncbi:MAG: response regulator receiver protein [Pedosphaera sp.]|nr:response regulator receiver protein [Pedosphaera sp.]
MTIGSDSNWTVLAAEDDKDARLFLEHAFQEVGIKCSLRFVSDGDEAIDYLDGKPPYADRFTHPLPEIVLLDVKMPRRDGFEVLKWIRGNERIKRLIVIMLTSSDEIKDIELAYTLGANSYLNKCSNLQEFVELVKSLDTYWLKNNRAPDFSHLSP